MTDRLHRTPSGTAARIVHLGLGAFFRAHVASYIEDAVCAEGDDWGVIGVSLQSPGVRDRLQPQGWAYTALELAPDGEKACVRTLLRDVLVAPENPQAVLDAMAAETTAIVTLTVTEKGYCHAPATGRLNVEHPDILHDIGHAIPKSAPGYIVRALQRRRDQGIGPFTVLCCDNLPENGRMVRGVILELAQRIDPALVDWISAHGAFPSTMVDRIVPATTPTDLDRLEALTGWRDEAPVLHEPFRQWVIEDDFCTPRPAFEKAGAQVVADVTPFELMKLRMLNGTHSALAYLGYLAGHETISAAMGDPALAGFVQRLWQDEIIPSLEAPEDTDLGAYARALAERYANPAIRHRTWQIAMDGSQKLPQRILGTIADNRAAGRPCAGLTLVVAAWMRYASGRDENGTAIDVRDPMAGRLASLWYDDPAETTAAFLRLSEVFPERLRADPVFAADLRGALTALMARGAKAAAAHV